MRTLVNHIILNIIITVSRFQIVTESWTWINLTLSHLFPYWLSYFSSWEWANFGLWMSKLCWILLFHLITCNGKQERQCSLYSALHYWSQTFPTSTSHYITSCTCAHGGEWSGTWRCLQPQYAGFYQITSASVSRFPKTGIRAYPGFWNQDMVFTWAAHDVDTPKTWS